MWRKGDHPRACCAVLHSYWTQSQDYESLCEMHGNGMWGWQHPGRHFPREEPYAVVPHVRICAGGGQQSPSLPRYSLMQGRVATTPGTFVFLSDADSFTYDASSRMLTAVSGRYSNTVTHTYDTAGRKATESLTISGQTYTATWPGTQHSKDPIDWATGNGLGSRVCSGARKALRCRLRHNYVRPNRKNFLRRKTSN